MQTGAQKSKAAGFKVLAKLGLVHGARHQSLLGGTVKTCGIKGLQWAG